MTEEEKRFPSQTAKKLILDNKKMFAKSALKGVARDIGVRAGSEIFRTARLEKIADGTAADFTTARNIAGDARRLFGFVRDKLEKNKEQEKNDEFSDESDVPEAPRDL